MIIKQLVCVITLKDEDLGHKLTRSIVQALVKSLSVDPIVLEILKPIGIHENTKSVGIQLDGTPVFCAKVRAFYEETEENKPYWDADAEIIRSALRSKSHDAVIATDVRIESATLEYIRSLIEETDNNFSVDELLLPEPLQAFVAALRNQAGVDVHVSVE